MVSGDEAERPANRVNPRTVARLLAQIHAELLLRAGADTYHNLRGPGLVHLFQKGFVGNGCIIDRGDVALFSLYSRAGRSRPRQKLLKRALVRQDPERMADFEWSGRARSCSFGLESPSHRLPLTPLRIAKKFLQVSEARDTRQMAMLQAIPERDHEAAVGQDDVGCQDRLSVSFIFKKPFEASPGGRDEQSSFLDHLRDRFFRGPVEERNSEDLFGAQGLTKVAFGRQNNELGKKEIRKRA